MKKYKVYNKDGNTYVTESDLNSDYELALETSDVDDVMDYIVDCYGTLLMEESIADDICYYDYMCLVKNGNANEIIDGLREV